MDWESGSTMEVTALGRPFGLGMLYDCRTDSLIPAITLWDCSDLMKDIAERPQTYNDFEIVASESIEDKSSALSVNASLKASFLGGLVEVGGSAKYLNDSKSSRNQARVTLKYKATTKIQELSMNQLGRGNVKHPYVFDQGLATHVVTAVLYGAQAFFVFDREVSEQEDQQDIQGNLKVMIKKIPKCAIDGEGSLKMEEKDKANVDKFSCRFYGDFYLPKPPTTFQDAIETYKNLPKLLGPNGEKAVPVKVWLLPLTCLDSSAAKLVREISIELVQEAQRVLEDISELEMRCDDVLRTITAQQFPQIGKKLKSFKEICSEFKLKFQQTLAKKLPSIRRGGEDEAELAEVLKKRHSSPFSSKHLNEWMDCKEREIYTLMSLTSLMKNTKIISSQTDLYKESLRAEQVVCFVFTSLGKDEPYLSALSKYLQGKTNPDLQDPHTHDVEKEQWYTSKEVTGEMRKKAKLFNDFSEANKENKNMKFLTVGLTETQKGSSIYLYKDGFAVSENFEPPSKPETVTAADINHNSVKLKISPPTFGAENITSYSVEYCVSGEDGWQPKTEAKAEEVTVRDLKPNTEYVFRCRAVTSAGVGPANEVSIKTLPCNELTKSGSKEARFAEKLGLQSEKISSDWPSVYKLPLTEEDMNIDGCRRFHFGKESTRQNHTIMLVGATGSGKSTLINAMINYIVGVEWEDSFRFKLVDKDQLRSEVSVYNINHQDGFKIPFSLTIIDTPGFGETGDIERDKLISEQLCNLFSAQHGVSVIDAVCFVAQAALARLTPTQKYVFDSVLSIFGKDVAENIRILVTFTNSRRPPVLEAIKAAGVPCPKTKDGLPAHFKFNDSALFANNKSPVKEYTDDTEGSDCDEEEENDVDDDNDNAGGEDEEDDVDNDEDEEQHNYDQYNDDISFDQMFWTMGTESMKMFFAALNVIETKSLTVTKEVLKERKQLEDSVEELQEQIKLQLARYEGMTNTRKKLGEYESDINNNKNPEFNVSVMKPYKADISGKGNFLINCQQCHVTCHHLFSASRESEKGGCAEDGSLGFCTECPGKCHINVHFLQKYKWEYQEVTEKRKVKDLKEKYLKPIKDQTVLEGLRANLRDEECLLRNDIKNLVKRSAKSLDRLKEISLNPNPLHTDKYISMIIDGEKSETKPGWQKRVEALIDIRGRRSFLDQFWWRFRF